MVQGSDCSAYGSRMTASRVAFQGAPYISGITTEKMKSFVSCYGLRFISDLGRHQLSQRYLIESQGQPRGINHPPHFLLKIKSG
ncbi:MAG: hypothetical protein WBB19_02670 [Desulforhopalus sp.]